jgi:hypothetical protein
MDQSDEVKVSSGKFYLVSGFRQHEMSTPASLLLLENSGINTEMENLRGLKVTSFNLGLGAGQYWVSANHFFIGGLVDIIGTFGDYKYETVSDSFHSSYLTTSYNLKLGLGYAGQVFKSGISFAADLTTLKSPGATYIRPSSNRILLYFRWTF